VAVAVVVVLVEGGEKVKGNKFKNFKKNEKKLKIKN